MMRHPIRSSLYILEGRKPIEADLKTWSKWFESADARRVAETKIDGYNVSTVFLGLDYSFSGGQPLLFETMIFPADSLSEVYCERCSTWEQAEVQHKIAVAWIKEKQHANP